jgi:hypothetical protein
MSKSLTLEAAILCPTCQHRSGLVEEYTFDRNFEPDEILLIHCTNPETACTQRAWFYCKTCKKRHNKEGLSRHSAAKFHKTRHAQKYSSVSSGILSEIPPQVPINTNKSDNVVTTEPINKE